MPTNLDRARIVSQHVQLEHVGLYRANVASTFNPLRVPEVELSQKHRCRYELPRDDANHLWVYVDFEFAALPKGDEQAKAPIVTLNATYLLIYTLPNASGFPSDALSHFAWLNGAYNAWPYWRELVQTVAGRVGFGTIVVPVYRPTVKQIPTDPAPLEAPAEPEALAGEPAS